MDRKFEPFSIARNQAKRSISHVVAVHCENDLEVIPALLLELLRMMRETSTLEEL